MTQIIVLPHVELCPKGALFEAAPASFVLTWAFSCPYCFSRC